MISAPSFESAYRHQQSHQVLRLDVLGATDGREVDTEQSGADDDAPFCVLHAGFDLSCVLERPEVVDAVGVGVLDGQLLWGATDRQQELVVGDRLARVGVDRVIVDVDVDDDRVESKVDVVVVVPRLLVDGDGGLGELAFRVLLDQDPVVEGLSLVVMSAAGASSRRVSAADAPAIPSPTITYESLIHERSNSGLMWVAILASRSGSIVQNPPRRPELTPPDATD